MKKPRTYLEAYLRGIGLLILALFFPLIVMITIASVFVGVNVSADVWRVIWIGTAAAELALLALAAFQWKRAWALTLNHPNRRSIAGFLVALAVVLLAGVVVFIAVNINDTCGC